MGHSLKNSPLVPELFLSHSLLVVYMGKLRLKEGQGAWLKASQTPRVRLGLAHCAPSLFFPRHLIPEACG